MEPPTQHVLHYRHPTTGRVRRRPVLGAMSCILALIGLPFVCLPLGGASVLDMLGPWTLAYFAIGAGVGIGASLRAEPLSLAATSICLHALGAAYWFYVGGWAYFLAGP